MNFLINLYLHPERSAFIHLEKAYQHKTFWFAAALLPLGLSLGYYAQQWQQSHSQQEQISLLQDEIQHHDQTLAGLKQQQPPLPEMQLGVIRHQIEQVIANSQAQLSHLQWDTDNHQLYFSLSERTIPLFRHIEKLQTLSGLGISELTLTKLNHAQRIQLDAVMQLKGQLKGEPTDDHPQTD